jgi:hypothetical protein
MEISFRCPHCKHEIRTRDLSHETFSCANCDARIQLRIGESIRARGVVEHCAVCDCNKVYIQKDFNRTLGVAILAVGAMASLILYGFNRVGEAFAVIGLFAAADFLLYRLLPNVVICYKCHAQYRGVGAPDVHEPFALGLAEKFDPLDKRADAENPATEWKER